MKKPSAKELALISLLSAAAVAVAFTHGLLAPYLPNVEFMTVIIFVSGFCFGWLVGLLVGVIAEFIYILFPYPWVSPAATITVTSPILMVIMAALAAFYGLAGGLRGRIWSSPKSLRRFMLEMAFWGFVLTFIFDIMSSVGFYVSYPGIYPSVWIAIYYTFIPIPGWMPYPPIVHTIANTIIFTFFAPALILAIKRLPPSS